MHNERTIASGLVLFFLVGLAGALLVRMLLLGERGSPGEHGHDHTPPVAANDGSVPGARKTPTDQPLLFKVGNAKCPTMGNDVDPKLLVVLEGLGIRICCPKCETRIRDDPDEAVQTLLADPVSGPPLAAWLGKHPEVRERLGMSKPDSGRKPATRPDSTPVSDRIVTAAANEICPVDGKRVGAGSVVADAGGLRIRLCNSACREQFRKDPPTYLSRLAKDSGVRARIQAHENLVARGGHGPHYHCASCNLRSAADGPCPLCGKALELPRDEPVFMLHNERCPVMGEVVKGDALVTFKGLGVRICCPKCDKTFRQHPSYYLAKLEREQGIQIPKIVEAKQ